MKSFIIVFIISLVTSCSSITAASIDFNPSMLFTYHNGGTTVQAKGTAGASFKIGDPLIITVRNQGIWSRCHVGAMNGDSYVTSSCKGSRGKFRVLDLGVITARTPEVISIVMVKGDSRSFGYLYVDLGKKRELLPISYTCPLQSNSGRVYTCVRQKGYRFLVDISIPQFVGSGKMQIVSTKCNGGEDRKLFDVEAGQLLQVEIGSEVAEYCAYRFDVKTAGDVVHKYSALLHIQFFDKFILE